MNYKRKIIYILTAIVVLLLIINVALGFFDISLPQKKLAALSKKTIESKFNTVLDDYGIEKSWITKGKIQKGKSDSLQNSFVIKTPSDVPVAQIIKDINIEFAHQPVIISSAEEDMNKLTNLIIESGKITKLVANFKIDKDITRKFSTISFLIYKAEKLDSVELSDFLKNPIHFGVILPLETNSPNLAQKIISAKKEYFIELDNNSDDNDFYLDEDLKVDEIKSNANKIIASFNSPKIFFIDENNSGIKRSIQNIIKETFENRGRKINYVDEFTFLKGENINDLKSLLKFHLNRLKPNETKIFRINIEDWIAIQENLNSFLKKGNKIIFPLQLL
jgi:hypothetical protein